MPVKFDILATLSYFDLFDYPLTQTEIFQFLRQSHSHDDVAEALIVLASENWVYKFEEFFSLRDDHHLIIRRRRGNARAREMLKTAEKIASFLSLFPFVRGVGVSTVRSLLPASTTMMSSVRRRAERMQSTILSSSLWVIMTTERAVILVSKCFWLGFQNVETS